MPSDQTTDRDDGGIDMRLSMDTLSGWWLLKGQDFALAEPSLPALLSRIPALLLLKEALAS